MSTAQDRKAPGAGTKVSLGENAPTTREGAGRVPPESLAAESYKAGGGFARNRGAEPEVVSPGSEVRSSGQQRHEGSGSAGSNSGAAAPTSVSDQDVRDKNRPHGKNLREGIEGGAGDDGLEKALKAEPGSENDPSRLAERQFQQGVYASAGGAGARQGELTGETRYDALESETAS